eukprot:3894352-Rhodomonas_salina.1
MMGSPLAAWRHLPGGRGRDSTQANGAGDHQDKSDSRCRPGSAYRQWQRRQLLGRLAGAIASNVPLVVPVIIVLWDETVNLTTVEGQVKSSVESGGSDGAPPAGVEGSDGEHKRGGLGAGATGTDRAWLQSCTEPGHTTLSPQLTWSHYTITTAQPTTHGRDRILR